MEEQEEDEEEGSMEEIMDMVEVDEVTVTISRQRVKHMSAILNLRNDTLETEVMGGHYLPGHH